MTSFTIDIDDAAVLAELRRLQERVGNLQPALGVIGEGIVRRAKARFSSSTGPDGQQWKANAPSTLRSKKGNKPLRGETGGLAREFHAHAGAYSVIVGNSMEYAAINQFGGEIERAAYSKLVRHRTTAKGELMRSDALGGKGLIFAKDSHKRALERWFEVAAHKIKIPARPFLPVHQDGTLYPAEEAAILADINDYLMAR